MALHPTSPFTTADFQRRQRKVCRELVRRGLDGLLMFRQESMYYVAGYATFGYCFFQCLYLGADGRMTLLTRLPDTIIAGLDSVIEDVRPWHFVPDANPAVDLKKHSRGARRAWRSSRYRTRRLWPDWFALHSRASRACQFLSSGRCLQPGDGASGDKEQGRARLLS